VTTKTTPPANADGFDFTKIYRSFLPINRAFLRSVNLREFNALVEQKDFQIIKQKIVRIGIGNVQTEMINQLILLLEPFFPASLANFIINSLPQFIRQR
jgi:hypothetical protein